VPAMIMCVRTECSDPASAGLAVDSARREAWLIELPDDATLMIPVCSAHADVLSVPAGWMIHDNRDDAGSALFADRSVPEAPARATVTRLDHRRARRSTKLEEPTLFGSNTTPTDSEIESQTPEEEPPSQSDDDAWTGRAGAHHSEMLDVDDATPLLARAFRSSQAS